MKKTNLAMKDMETGATHIDIRPAKKVANWDSKYMDDGRRKPTAADPLRDKELIPIIAEYLETHAKTKRLGLRNKMAFMIGVTTGLRSSDILNLRIGDVYNFDGTFVNYVVIRERKTWKMNDPKLSAKTKDAIIDYLTELGDFKPEDFLVQSERGGQLNRVQWYTVLQKAQKGLGLSEHISSHTMRKTFGYHTVHNNPNDLTALEHLQGMFNHSSTATTLRYCGITREEEDKYYDEMDDLFD